MNQESNLEADELKISSKIKFPTLRSLFATIGKQLSELLKSPRIGIYLRGRESGNWALAISKGIAGETEQLIALLNDEKSTELANAIRSCHPCLLEEIIDPKALESVNADNLIIAPMVYEDEAMGLLLADFDAFAALSERDLVQLSLAALLFKVAIEKEFLALKYAKLEKDTTAKSLQDPQAFLNNESIIKWFLDIEIERSLRHGTRFAIMVMAVDNMVQILTQHGQSSADFFMTKAHESLNWIVRKCDFLTRRGGEKLMCVSMEQNEGGAMVFAEKCRHRAKENAIAANGVLIPYTISVGISLWPEGDKMTAEELIRRAELALKIAQERGNRVRLWKLGMTD